MQLQFDASKVKQKGLIQILFCVRFTFNHEDIDYYQANTVILSRSLKKSFNQNFRARAF